MRKEKPERKSREKGRKSGEMGVQKRGRESQVNKSVSSDVMLDLLGNSNC